LAPEVETYEVREIYRKKGFEGKELEKIVEVITANPDVWVQVMMSEEFQMAPPEKSQALNSGLVVGLAAIVGSLIPLVPFFFLPISTGIWLSLVLSALTLFAVGAYKARITIGKPFRSGLQMTLIGIVSALVGYVVGLLFKVPTTP
jgi:VIT1/CCC1 family predicted Fe2+/Mn2+ transporter